MSKPRSRTKAASTDSQSAGDDFVLVNRTAEDAAASAAEQEAYERKLDDAYKAEMLGLDLPPVAPPGHHLQPVIEKPKVTFWTLLFRRAENRSTLYQLYFTTALMAIVPLGMMGLSYYTIFAGMSEESRLTWSGLFGVLGVNVIAIGFGVFAYFDRGGEEGEEEEVSREDEQEAKRKKWAEWEKAQEEEATREDRERLQALREAHEAKQTGKTATAATTEETTTTTKRRKAKDADAPQRDSAIADEPAEEEAAPAEEAASTGSRTKRARSKKAL